MQNVKLNIIPGSVMPVINVSQYDEAREFSLSVYEGATAYSLTGKDVQIRGTKPDGNGFAYDAADGVVSVSGNTVTISTTQQMTAVGGQTMAELRITSGDTILGTLNFILMVEPSALSDDTPISETEIPAIERLAEAQVEQAEAWARGTKGGAPVSSDEPQYEDNSYYWSQVAAQYAAGGLHFMGSVAFASIPTTGMVNGDEYNITDDFTTDARFIEGAGVDVKAGSNIAWLADPINKWDVLATGGGAEALSDLTDVAITSAADGDLLQYNGTSQKWENSNAVPQELAAMQEAGAVNLLPIQDMPEHTSRVINGITFTFNADWSITVSGIASANAELHFASRSLQNYRFDIPSGKYKTRGCPAGGSANTYGFTFSWVGSSVYFDYGAGATFDYPGNAYVDVGIFVKKDVDLTTPITFYPMLYDARLVNPPYQPFTMTNRELTDGLLKAEDITSEITINLTRATYSTFKAYKYGKVVQLTFTELEKISSSNQLTTMPEKYAPFEQVWAILMNNNSLSTFGFLYANTGGSLAFTNATPQNIKFDGTLTWIIA